MTPDESDLLDYLAEYRRVVGKDACETCGAQIGERCEPVTDYPHAPRVRAAQERGDLPLPTQHACNAGRHYFRRWGQVWSCVDCGTLAPQQPGVARVSTPDVDHAVRLLGGVSTEDYQRRVRAGLEERARLRGAP